MAISWTITVLVPQLEAIQQSLDALGVIMADGMQEVRDALIGLNDNLSAGNQALQSQLAAIAVEIEQVAAAIAGGGAATEDDLLTIAQHIRDASDIAAQQASLIQANTAKIEGIVEPSGTPPA